MKGFVLLLALAAIFGSSLSQFQDECNCTKMGAPITLCPDKVNYRGPGPCLVQKTGQCLQKYMECPGDVLEHKPIEHVGDTLVANDECDCKRTAGRMAKCPDGKHFSGPGPCVETTDGTCTQKWLQCPETKSDSPSLTAPTTAVQNKELCECKKLIGAYLCKDGVSIGGAGRCIVTKNDDGVESCVQERLKCPDEIASTLVSSTLLTETKPKPAECNVICPDLYKPVCGSDGRTYGNDCELKGAACNNAKLFAVYEGECKKEEVKENPCESTKCDAGQICILQKVACFTQPCKPIAKCVVPENKEDQRDPITNADLTAEKNNADLVPVRPDDDFCGKCPKDTKCIVTKVQCIKAPCPPMVECVKPEAAKDPPENSLWGGITTGADDSSKPKEPVKANCDGEIACLAVYKPVCGSDGQTYGNSCELSQAICKNPKISVVYSGPCKKENLIKNPCDEQKCEEGTVCVIEKVTCITTPCDPIVKCVKSEDKKSDEQPRRFTDDGSIASDIAIMPFLIEDPCLDIKCESNAKCVVSEAICKRAPCPRVATCVKSECTGMCPDLYKPVCGSDGQTYGNNCELSQAACKNPKIIQASLGECKKVTLEDAIGGKGKTNPCDTVKCTANTVCVLEKVDCIQAPCEPQAKCIATPNKEESTNDLQPERVTSEGKPAGKIDNEPVLLEDPCADLKCGVNTKCVISTVECLQAPCPRFAKCASTDELIANNKDNADVADKGCLSQIACMKIYRPVCGDDGITYGNECQLQMARCRGIKVGSKYTEGECVAVKLDKNPCDEKKCGDSEICVVEKVTCVTDPCPPLAVCKVQTEKPVPLPVVEDKTKPAPTEPTLVARVDKEDICKDMKCSVGTACKLRQVQCIKAPCNPIASCEKVVDNNGDVVAVTTDCPAVPNCPRLFAPVCGSDGKTYDNHCFYKAARCKNTKLSELSTPGRCPSGCTSDATCNGGKCVGATPKGDNCDLTAEGCTGTCQRKDLDPCSLVKCTATQKCKLSSVQCFRAPCNPVAQCVDVATPAVCDPSAMADCQMDDTFRKNAGLDKCGADNLAVFCAQRSGCVDVAKAKCAQPDPTAGLQSCFVQGCPNVSTESKCDTVGLAKCVASVQPVKGQKIDQCLVQKNQLDCAKKFNCENFSSFLCTAQNVRGVASTCKLDITCPKTQVSPNVIAHGVVHMVRALHPEYLAWEAPAQHSANKFSTPIIIIIGACVAALMVAVVVLGVKVRKARVAAADAESFQESLL